MVIEPDRVMALQYATGLAKKGYEISVFQDSATAIQSLQSSIPDAVIMELAVPAHNGLEFLYELRSYSDTDRVSVVINSFVQSRDVPFGFVTEADLGISAYLDKTFTTVDSLDRTLKELQ